MNGDELLLLAHGRHYARSGKGRRRCLAADLSAAELAGALGVSAAAISHWERGQRSPRGRVGRAYGALISRLGGRECCGAPGCEGSASCGSHKERDGDA